MNQPYFFSGDDQNLKSSMECGAGLCPYVLGLCPHWSEPDHEFSGLVLGRGKRPPLASTTSSAKHSADFVGKRSDRKSSTTSFPESAMTCDLKIPSSNLKPVSQTSRRPLERSGSISCE